MKKVINRLLDKSVIFSFDRSGFERHAKEFTSQITTQEVSGKNIFITGGTSGMGKALAEELADLGGNIVITGRSKERGEKIAAASEQIQFLSMDLAEYKNYKPDYFSHIPVLDSLVLNAGGMPESMELNKEEIEAQSASQLFGHFYLMKILRELRKINEKTRIIWVSSGGMYLSKLNLNEIIRPNEYDKVARYAEIKRAQVSMVEFWSSHPDWSQFQLFSMHPGWLATAGLNEALPKFSGLLKGRLRTPAQGVDTIKWLIGTHEDLVKGKFYFDRKVVSPYINDSYIPESEDLKKLDQIIKERT